MRRDLALLSEQGVLRKVHGGAVLGADGAREPAAASGGRRRGRRRSRSAGRRRRCSEPGDSLLIDAGTTTAYFADALGKAGGFTVITNSVLVAKELWHPRRTEARFI